MWNEIRLTGWGRTSSARTRAARPERAEDVDAAVAGSVGGTIVAHGAGRSYGDVALNDGGFTILTRRLNRFLDFDAGSGEVVVEPGVTFRDLIAALLPQGYLAPVSPGTAFTTIGGAIANDVHGKNHELNGTFGDHVKWVDLLLASGERRRVSPESDAELFRATIGGLGLTGVITAACFPMMPVPSNAVRREERRMANIDDFLAGFAEATARRVPFTVGWIDGAASGASLGRGILELAWPSPVAAAAPRDRNLSVPFDFPSLALNSYSVRAFNEVYYRRIPRGGRERVVPLAIFLYPLDAILQWNRIYGDRGFYQFQCVLPPEQGAKGLRHLLETISRSRGASFLAVLKAMGRGGSGLMSFPAPGYTLALDFPRQPETIALLRQLHRITLDYGGRVYLAKDACMTAETCAEMYPGLESFRSTLGELDPEGRITSDLARRLRIRR